MPGGRQDRILAATQVLRLRSGRRHAAAMTLLHHAHAAQRHRRAGQHRTQQEAGRRIEHARRDRDFMGSRCRRSAQKQVLAGSGASWLATARWHRRPAARSSRISAMSAASIATPTPSPMAMPTSARASAGASLMPSPTIATTRPSTLQSLGFQPASPAGVTPATTSRTMPAVGSDRVRDGWAIAGEQHDIQAGRTQAQAMAGGLVGSHRVGQRDDAREHAHRRQRRPESGRARQDAWRRRPAVRPRPIPCCMNAALPTAAWRARRRRRPHRDRSSSGRRWREPRRGHDRRASATIAAASGDVAARATRHRQQLRTISSIARCPGSPRARRSPIGLPAVTVPVLSSTHGVDVASALQRIAALDQHRRAGHHDRSPP